MCICNSRVHIQQSVNIIIELNYKMIIELDKYTSNSLRKGRTQGFQTDLLQAYTLFSNHMLEPNQITIKQFDLISQRSNMRFIIECKADQQQEDEYTQFLYQVLIDNYFLKKNQSKQIFCVFALYLFYCRQDKKKKIRIDAQVTGQLKKLIVSNKHNQKADFMKIIKRLSLQAFSYHIKYGVSNLLTKQTLQGQKKNNYWGSGLHKKQLTSSVENNDSSFFNQIRKQMPELQASLRSYQTEKKTFNLYQQENQELLECWGINVTKRIQKLILNYQRATKLN